MRLQLMKRIDVPGYRKDLRLFQIIKNTYQGHTLNL
jgi:hypothetical protein